MDPASDPSQDPIATLLESYNELNSAQITVLYEEPSALEFMRYVATNRPFVVRGAANDVSKFSFWGSWPEGFRFSLLAPFFFILILFFSKRGLPPLHICFHLSKFVPLYRSV